MEQTPGLKSIEDLSAGDLVVHQLLGAGQLVLAGDAHALLEVAGGEPVDGSR